MEGYLDDLSASLGFEVDQLRYVICLFLAYPLALIHRTLPDSPTLKHLFAGGIGFGMGWFCFGEGMVHSVITSIVTYLIMSLVKGSLGPKLVFAFALGHLSISHMIRQYENYGGYELDYTGPQMVLVLKLTSFAYNVYDGQNFDKCSEDQKSRAIKKMPSLLEYFGFIYFFGSFLAGPALEIKEYLEFTDMTLFPLHKDGKRRIPPSFLPSMGKLALGLFCFSGIVLKGMYPVLYTTTTEFLTQTSFFYRLFYVNLAVSLQRFQYYFIWTIAEGACVMAGAGYTTTVNGRHIWDRASNVDILSLEFAQNFKGITDSWNKKTNLWLKNYVYLRLTPPNGKPSGFVTLATYMTSAFWHGFYPGYYITFFSGAIMTIVARGVRQKIRPLFMVDEKTPKGSKVFYDFISWMTTFCTLNYVCSAFVLLDFGYTWRVYQSIYFCVHVGALLLYIITLNMKSQKPKPKSS